MPKISVVSLGCPKNLVDSDNLLRVLADEGFRCAEDIEDAEVVLVNTCGFIEEAKRESIEEILKLRHIKREGKKLLVFGCLAKRYGKELVSEIPEIDALWGVGEEDKIVEYCKSTVIGREGRRYPGRVTGGLRTAGHKPSTFPYAYLKIAEGCSRRCTYCVIPSIRGPYRSLEPDKILKTAEEHVRSGVKELVLVAQDSVSYGREFKGYNLSSLLRDISSINGDFWVRLLYLYPSSISGRLISEIASNKKVCKYLDIPLQHSEDRVLRAMGRAGTKESYAGLIRRIREAIPGVTLRTTFMVGFPGETERDFTGLKNFVREIGFDRLGVFMYSKEEGTPSAKLKNKVSLKVKKMRREEIMKLQSRLSLEKNMALIGKRFRALVDEVQRDTFIARLSSQAPEIDGVVIIDTSEVREIKGLPKEKTGGSTSKNFRAPGPKVGEFANVLIKDAYDYDLKGEIVQ
jgi:ribosomal protein S12 methylthiotransferase